MILYHWMRKILDQLFPLLVSRNSILETKSMTLTLLYFLPLYFVMFLYFYFHQKNKSKKRAPQNKKSLFFTFVFCYVIIHHNSHIDYMNGNATKIQNIYRWMRNSLDQLFVLLVSRNSILESKSMTLTLLYFVPLYFVMFPYFYFHQKINQKNKPLKINILFYFFVFFYIICTSLLTH